MSFNPSTEAANELLKQIAKSFDPYQLSDQLQSLLEGEIKTQFPEFTPAELDQAIKSDIQSVSSAAKALQYVYDLYR